MPKFLKNDAIHLLEGGVEAYVLGMYGMVFPSSRIHHKPDTKYAPVMGLFGSSVELLLKACLVQAKGSDAMYKENSSNSKVYKFANDVIDEIKKEINDNTSDISFIYSNDDPNSHDYAQHKEQLIFYINKFKLLQGLRADGLHAASGCSNDIAVSIANDIYSFIQLLSKSKKLKAYLKNVPAPAATVRDREAIIEDLQRRVDSAKDSTSKVTYIRNMFLVLPYIPEVAPDWVSVFDRVAVAPPSEADVSYLVKTLSDAHSIYLLKNRGGKEGVPVRVEKDNPSAIPIAIQNIKRTLSTTPDKFNNDVLTANTRLEENRLDLPLDEFIMELYSVGLSEAGLLTTETKKLTAQQTWPYVAAAYSTQGTPRPCWFFIRACDEIEKLIAFLQRVEPIAKGYYKRRHKTLIKLLNAYKDDTSVFFKNERDPIFADAQKMIYLASKPLANPFTPAFLRKHSFSDAVNECVKEYIADENKAGDALIKLLQLENWTEEDKKAANCLLHICMLTSKDALVCASQSDRFKSMVSQIRKAIFVVDLMEDGPLIQ